MLYRRSITTRTRPVLLFALLLCAFAGFAGRLEAQSIGILSVADETLPLHLTRLADRLLLAEARKLTGEDVISSQSLREQLREIDGGERILDECADPACAAELARMLGLEVIITLEIESGGGGYPLRLSAVRNDGSLIGTAAETVYDIRDFDDGVARAGEALAIAAGLIEAPAVAEASQPEPESSSGGERETATTDESGSESATEPADEPGDDPTTATEETSAGEPAGASGQEEPGEDAPLGGTRAAREVIPQPVQDPLRRSAFFASLAALQLGNLANMATFITDTESVTNYYLYLGASDQSDLDRYYRYYESYHLVSRISAVSAYTLNGAASIGAGYALFGGPPEEFGLSRRGRDYLYTGLATALAGNLLYLSALDSMAAASYLSARADLDSDPAVEYYKNRAAAGSAEALVLEAAVIGLWGLGTAAMSAAPLQDESELTPIASNFWDKVLIGSGVLFLTGGNVMASQAGFRRTAAAESYYQYVKADFDEVAAAWEGVEEDFDAFYLNAGIAAGLWLTGAAFFVTAELFDFPDPFRNSGNPPLLGALRLAPTYNGGVLYVHLEL